MSAYHTVTKTYGHERGFSVAFRQHRATSHCRFLHGYALQISLEFGATELDAREWVVDFGSMKPVKQWLEDNYDHKTLVAMDDPQVGVFETLAKSGAADVRLVASTGCESFAREIFTFVRRWLQAECLSNNPQLLRVTVSEHPGNSAGYGE